MPAVVLKLKRPCCNRVTQVRAWPHVPRERYYRVCRPCAMGWDIERTTLRDKDGVRVDKTEWTLKVWRER